MVRSDFQTFSTTSNLTNKNGFKLAVLGRARAFRFPATRHKATRHSCRRRSRARRRRSQRPRLILLSSRSHARARRASGTRCPSRTCRSTSDGAVVTSIFDARLVSRWLGIFRQEAGRRSRCVLCRAERPRKTDRARDYCAIHVTEYFVNGHTDSIREENPAVSCLVLLGWRAPLGFGLEGRLLLARRGRAHV